MNSTGLNLAQQEQLLKGINPTRVKTLHDGTKHLEAWDVRAHLIRVFGHGNFSVDLLDYDCAYETDTTTRDGKPAVRVGYRARVRLTIHATGATYTEAAFGQSVMPDYKRGDAHDMALKTAESQALKRAAINLGDQFGLSLYRDGDTREVVIRTLDHTEQVA
jgi:recombination DNA repair RAD52 pathway protein